MPATIDIKTKVIRVIDNEAPITRRTLEKYFPASTRPLAQQVVSNLLGAGRIVILGTGRRGDPERIVKSLAWPNEQCCPLCGKAGYDKDNLGF